MVKDPRVIDKRIPFVLALLIALFCYYTWAPASPFKKLPKLALEQALSSKTAAWAEGSIVVKGISPLQDNTLYIHAKVLPNQALSVIIIAPAASNPNLNSRWRVEGKLLWQDNIAVLDTISSKGKFEVVSNQP
ncbi:MULTISPECIES: hypothetical protein [unclassified Agarivorans]|uniref:hypothetical protein n=1 Tax=unclassified Agarivorans TaxID=2636026 RepID=UPI0026E12683|nr:MULTISPECIES: hypothetical protein [unclassified Agarivorans]MDO6685127.1 hypothetical protein [Agarivorans sp. 3_MG-2023]MDO6715701.1 hypothetical protein [Agarivorans sp. 2_MG-2023]